MERLPHGYTNETALDDSIVIKRYVGLGASGRQRTEKSCLEMLGDVLPVPALVHSESSEIRMIKLAGVHGKELIETKNASSVMSAMGAMLDRVHSTKRMSLDIPGDGTTLIHGDYGPQNILFTPSGNAVVGLLDWEWAHYGQPIEDLAWVEWAVRTHHPKQVELLSAFYISYGLRPDWSDRQDCMISRCSELKRLDPADRGGGHRVSVWDARIERVKSWQRLSDE